MTPSSAGLLRSAGSRVAVTVLLLAAAGGVGGLAWAWLTQPAAYRVTAQGAYLDEEGLSRIFNADGWFLVIGLVLGCLARGRLAYAFRRDGWVVVLAVLAGAGVASAVCYLVGHALGPDALDPRLRAAGPGDRVRVPLTIQATGVYLSWPLGAMAGALVAAFAWSRRDPVASAPVQVPRSPRFDAGAGDPGRTPPRV